MQEDDIARLWTKVEKREGCWSFNAKPRLNGYYHFYDGQRDRPAHRVVYELVKGEVSDELVLDHLCRNQLCVNPDHLEPVTNKINILRGESPAARNARKTHCLAGHTLSGTNLYLTRQGWRQCRQCRATINHERWLRRKNAPGHKTRQYSPVRSGVSGVSWHKSKLKWHVEFTIDSQKIYVGTFKDLADAKRALHEARAGR